jgi:streptomycin 6-kinase
VTAAFDRYDGNYAYRELLPPTLVADARRILAELQQDPPPARLLHGDVHHDNIVSSQPGRGNWLAIDPNPGYGDPGYDVGSVLYNPLPWVATVPDVEEVLRRRVRRLSRRLHLDPDRLTGWAFVRAIVSEIDFIDDDGLPNGTPLRVAGALRRML